MTGPQFREAERLRDAEQFTLTTKEQRLMYLASGFGGMYPGVQWDLASKRFNKLAKAGLVREYIPHNPVHKVRAVATPKGEEALKASGYRP